MKKKMRILAPVLALTLALSACGGGSGSGTDNKDAQNPGTTDGGTKTEAKDTITALLPPVSGNFQDRFAQLEKDFTAMYPNLTLKIEPASWEDMTQKLDTQVNAGSPPDIAFIPSGGLSKYVEQGMLMDITDTATKEMIEDFDAAPLEYMKMGSSLYGFPGYMEVHAIGGNKQFLEEAGIDYKKVQKEGWTYEEFREQIKKGVVKEGDKTSRYGFVFATAGVASRDYLTILIKNAGMPHAFDKDLKYAYTSKNFLEVLKAIRQMIDDGSMPKELSSVDAGKRWNMFLTGQTMITGKGLATFENNANQNNEKIKANDGSAVSGSIPVEYIVLPVPTFAGQKQSSSVAVDGYVTFRGKNEPTPEHKANVVKAAYFLAAGEVAATTNNDLFAAHITKSGREAAKDMKIDRNPDNVAAVETLLTQATPARTDIPTDMGAKGIKLEDEVIIPKLQALIAGEITPEQMYDAVKEGAVKAFGEDGIVKD
ncbi:carbohydrate ABC transporter substrate-binding protein, CUT1 family (TC 3.A.1.1.-) [Paenibacillus uliginis N3/975]|uniref:Carbohydrate ABC transporter substrate-binding protein, CUT1 family (TC 3.A.1.1.-) n=1 Tax=Paenibacillus uliginis N3/975 TaxID=1313296 RepID=A0A1X7HHU0_9BACL|nr:extracellular solute-binding protein [Paenibacillus uliginis]SMF86942.1 carbohydrate ABC transporter substrate-binding protein, CUT1 family (TC 3.A.1.1.-) [Paenibacillus uliginis N3/975]